jgi:prephenate dehydrogenase
MLDILSTNRDNVLESLSRFRKQIDVLENLLKEDNLPALEIALNSAAIRQKQLLLTADG